MMPAKVRNKVFDKISGVTMRPFFNPATLATAEGLTKEVLTQSQRDFFINGTITSHAASPPLMAGMWSGGREIALTNQHLPAWFKKAMGAALSEVNQCPYCEDMLLSLTRGAKETNVADSLQRNNVGAIDDVRTRKRIEWTKGSVSRSYAESHAAPFNEYELPEALGTLIVFNYTNKISDFTMNGSPVPAAFRGGALKAFGLELRDSAAMHLEHGVSLSLLSEAPLPEDLRWAESNPLVADALARWNGVVEKEVDEALSKETQAYIRKNLHEWNGEQAPISRAWVEEEIKVLEGIERDKARLVLVVAKASYQMTDSLIQTLVDQRVCEADLVRLGAWASLMGAKTVTNWSAVKTPQETSDVVGVA